MNEPLDIDDPTWDPAFNVGEGAMSFGETGHSQESVRTTHGALDLLHAVREEVTEFVDREMGEAHRREEWPPNQPRPKVVQTFPHCADNWRGVTYTLAVETHIVVARDDRTRVVVTNWGPGVVYVARDTGTGLNEPQFNAVQIAVGGTREFRTRGDLWAFPAAGQLPVVDVQDEFGLADVVGD